ncbi:MAG: EAL domain-containing protein [Synechococcales cyanobacterium M58_A2018_015]|nr:EAL domain-containing protein [Synechococcales cyanobacterium M58_A2018_015]
MTFFSSDQSLILIVDDTPANLTVISEVLSDAGFEIAIATSGERALEQARRDPPDLILLDIMMPGIGGFETCCRLKADPHLHQIPIIFMTALTDVENKVRGLELGAVDYITKPFQEQEVVARVKTHLELRQTQLQLQRSEERLTQTLNALQEVVWSAGLNPFEILYLNPSVKTIYGLSPHDLIAAPHLWIEQIAADDRAAVRQHLVDAPGCGSFELEYRVVDGNGEVHWVHCTAKIQLDESTQRLRVDGILQDISARRLVEQKLLYAAQHDSLTQLANRSFFTERLSELLAAYRGQDGQFALLFIDLDRFKSVNDSLGHRVGDELLIRVSEILVAAVQPTDLVARLGGDEFTILIDGIAGEEEAVLISDRIQERLQRPIFVGEHLLNITASIGVVIGSNAYQSADDMLRDADIAMYQAKGLGRACHKLFCQEMYEQIMDKLYLENELKYALKRRELFLEYQPILTLATEDLVGFEVLLRWRHGKRGLIPPDQFIPLAEETGWITKIGEYVLRAACLQMKTWQQMHPAASRLTISINLSSYELQSIRFLETIDRIITESRLDPGNLKLEITESSLMKNNELSLQNLRFLQGKGIGLSLDDFGTGYSSLSYLHQFPIHTLKIDRSFVQTMEPGLSSFEIIRTIITLARALNIEVVAEGVETATQVNYLKMLNCEMVQGYFFSKPLSAAAATQYLQRSMQDKQRTALTCRSSRSPLPDHRINRQNIAPTEP